MSETTTSQAHNTEPFRRMAEEQVTRLKAAMDEGKKLEDRWLEQMNQAVDEHARLTRATLGWTMQMTAEWRRASTDVLQRTAELFSGRS